MKAGRIRNPSHLAGYRIVQIAQSLSWPSENRGCSAALRCLPFQIAFRRKRRSRSERLPGNSLLRGRCEGKARRCVHVLLGNGSARSPQRLRRNVALNEGAGTGIARGRDKFDQARVEA